MKKIIVLVLTVYCLSLPGQDVPSTPTTPSAAYLQKEYKTGYLLNLNGSYNKFGELRHSSIGFKIGAVTEKKWAFGLHFNFIQLGIGPAQTWQLKGGPMFRYYLDAENFRFFLGGQASYATFNRREQSGTNLKSETFLYGPQLGINIPLNRSLFLELLAEHLWNTNVSSLLWVNDGDRGFINYEIGILMIL